MTEQNHNRLLNELELEAYDLFQKENIDVNITDTIGEKTRYRVRLTDGYVTKIYPCRSSKKISKNKEWNEKIEDYTKTEKALKPFLKKRGKNRVDRGAIRH